MNRTRVAILLGALLSASAVLHAQGAAGSIQGHVINGTTNRPVAKAQVNYVMMTQGPAPLDTATTDAQGHFQFNKAAPSGGAPVLLRVEYEGATYSQPVMPQQPTGDLEIKVFDASNQHDLVAVKEHAIFLHPSGNTLLVLEQVVLGNSSNPPKTYVNAKGTFPFTLAGTPQQAVQVSVDGPGGMPINQTPVARDGKNSYTITYPIRPGETQVRLEYALPYKSPFEFTKTLDVPPQQMHVVTPGKDVQLSGESLTPVGSDPQTGFLGYAVVPNGNTVKLQVSGEVPVKAEAGQGEEGEESANLVPIPSPVSERRWLIVSAAGLVMLIGLFYHYTRS